MTIRVLLADDQPLIRTGFKLILDSEPGITVVGEACDGAEAVGLARTARPDIVLMDIRMPEMDGLDATRHIVADDTLTGVRILILTTFENDDNIVRALRAGASGFLGKNVEPYDLVRAVRTVAGGEALLSPHATQALITQFLSRPELEPLPDPGPAALGGLTDREKEVLVLVAHGLSNDEIAERLYVSPLTAKTHVNRAMTKLGIRDRAQLVVLAYQRGIVRPGDTLT
ncbi:response regulator [Actinoplanes subglobosus]|uniref:Response regulator n=1 Tax=Actinoplanes subglobosus TaxID=1547892 RepID=A0ABV8IR60_9ACTN